MTVRDAEGNNPTIVASARLEVKIADTKLYVIYYMLLFYQKKMI